MFEPDILEEKDDQMDSKEIIETTEEERKAKLLKKIKFDEKIEKLKPFEVEDILELRENQWKEIFGDSEGILYFNRISKLKVKTF